MTTLSELWHRQRFYNDILRRRSSESKEEWTKTYLLGLISEEDELLREINWKRHRRGNGNPPNIHSIGIELADMMKYVMSLCELWGFEVDEILDLVERKTDELELRMNQENKVIPKGSPVLILDLDGTIADWRGSFIKWLREKGIEPTVDDAVSTLMIDFDLEIRYDRYSELKDEFESSGMYEHLLPYGDAISVVNSLKLNYKTYVIVNTARPFAKYKRIWMDTWNWIEKNGIMVDELNMSSFYRILHADKLRGYHEVIMFDDDPELIERGATCGIHVFARKHPYNSHVKNPNVTFVEKYTDIPLEKYFLGG